MRQRNKILIIILIIITAIIGIYSYTSYESYQNITIGGLTCEVPVSDVNITKNDYQIYDNSKNQLKIVVYDEIGEENNTTTPGFDELRNTAQKDSSSESKNNVTFNKTQSGLYSYYGNYSGRNVLITTPDENTIIHILKTLKVEPLEVEVVDDTNQTTDNSTVSTKNGNSPSQPNTKTSTKKSSTKSSSSGGGDDGYHYSGQYSGYIKEYTTSDGIQHVHRKDGYHEYYNPKTGYIHSKDKYGNEYSDYFV